MLIPHMLRTGHQVEQQGAGDVVRQVADDTQAATRAGKINRQGIALYDRQAFWRMAMAQARRQIPVNLDYRQMIQHIQQRPRQRRESRARSEEHTSELQSLMRISYAVFCLKKKTTTHNNTP